MDLGDRINRVLLELPGLKDMDYSSFLSSPLHERSFIFVFILKLIVL